MPKGHEILSSAKSVELFHRATELLPQDALEQYHEALVAMLKALQKANQSNTFGICKTCKYFTKKTDGYLCGLTQETLNDDDSEKICQEHKAA